MASRVWGIAVVCALACTACAGASAEPVPSAAPPPTVLHDVAVASSSPAKASTLRVPPKPRGAGAYLMARLRRPLHTPFGTVRPKTLFGDPVWVPVVARTGAQATVLAPVRPHARPVRLDLRGLALRWTSVRVVVDLAAGRLSVVRAGRTLGSFPIGYGTPATPTPVGRFFVTDRLRFPAGSPYAPLAFALAAHQTHLAPGWPGGDLVAIHPGAMGAVSNGCIHVGLPALALLRRDVPLGTMVTVSAG
jgi:L,D-transpeptidase catalytic domain